ncbi:strawberry notch 1 [Cricetulus griseus]
MVEPGQDLLLAALSESGISPNDLFDVDGGDAGLATPTPPSVQQSMPLSALELGLETEAAVPVKQEPETMSTPALLNVRKVPVVKEEDEPEEEDEEEMGHAETYAEYMPIKLKIGLRHPDAVVETSSLSSVTPPDVWYKTSISEETIDNGWLSALQLEAVTYAAQIVFDECHKAKNLCPVGSSKPTKTGLAVLELQNKLPKARVVYASATGASEPRNMAYMNRLGIWGEGTPFREFSDFIQAVERRGVLQSLIEKHFPAPDRKKLYSLLGIDLTAPSNNSSPRDSPCKENKIKKRKGEEITREAKKARKVGGLTGSSSDDSGSESDVSDNEESDYESSKNMSSGDDDDFNPFRDESSEDNEDANSNTNSNNSLITSQDAVERAQQMKKDLLDKLDKLAEDLPPNTLDELIDDLGGPENVAEMTGRKGRVVSNDDGSISYESRTEIDVPVEILNITEKQRFMDGKKNIAIISEAASSGISLQADRRAQNQRRRVHMTLELPWSADRAIQQFGRTHRSNQVTAPEYVFLISELAGEQRFASIVAKRLESLGALTHGDRRATESRDLSRFNFDNKYGRNALEIVMKSIVNLDSPMVSPPPDYPGEFFKDVRQGLIGVGLINVEDRSGILTLDKDYNNIGKFLNRILGMEVHQQNALFQYFADTLTAVVQNAKKNGRYDMGILDLGSGDEKVRKSDVKKFLTPGYSTSGHVELYTISVERGMSWEEATKIWAELTGPDDGFYLSLQIRNNKKTAILVKEVNPKKKLFLIYRPNTGKQLKLEIYADLKKKYKKVVSDDALVHWLDQYNSSADTCTHAYWRGNCKKASLGLVCEIGLRCRTYYVLCGSVLSVWTKVEGVLASVSGTNVKMQIVRLRTEDGQRIVGLIIPANCVSPLVNLLSTSDQSQQLAVQQKQLWQQHHPQSITNLSNS